MKPNNCTLSHRCEDRLMRECIAYRCPCGQQACYFLVGLWLCLECYLAELRRAG